ncbi:MAG TPA: cation diffusion facilitator family transporter [Gammaproteobacteria bacterium]|nr:cation diffusion facilitator family transporter [Gammaproteobacteria bacterium]
MQDTGLELYEKNARLMKRATYASVITGSLLAAIKLVAYLFTGSVAMLSSLVDSLLDIVASLINLIAVRHSLVPADEEHRFGHGKVESIAGLAQAAFITGSALFIIFEAVNRLVNPGPILHGTFGIVVMIVSIVVTALLVMYQRHVIKKTKSVAINADSLHYFSDLLVNASVIVAIVLSTTLGWTLADPLIAIGIAAFIMYSAWQIAKECLNQLMDRELPDGARENIESIAMSHKEVMDVHHLRTRTSGRDIFIQFHIKMDRSLPLETAHRIAVEVESEIVKAYPNADVIIHQDPDNEKEEHSRE